MTIVHFSRVIPIEYIINNNGNIVLTYRDERRTLYYWTYDRFNVKFLDGYFFYFEFEHKSKFVRNRFKNKYLQSKINQILTMIIRVYLK